MAELAGLIGRREARISRGQFQIISVGRDFPGSETSKPNRCLISSEACMAVAPMLQRFHPNFGIQRERKGGEDAKHPPFRPDPPSSEESELGQTHPTRYYLCVARGR